MKIIQNTKLLDLSRIIVGPYASMVLSDFGVQVIKVQAPEGDPTRQWGPPWHQHSSAYFHSVNRDKKSINLDLKKQSHKEVLRKLAAKSDAVIENFIPGVTKKLGIDYDSLKKQNEKLVYCSISGYGDIGPLKNAPAFDNIMQAEAGFMHLTGDSSGPPFKLGFAITDVVTALYASNAVLAGLLHREQTGKGMYLRTSLYECAVSALINQGSNFLNGEINPRRMGNHHPNILPYGLYETADSPIIICVGTPQQYLNMIEVLKMKNREEFSTNGLRVKNREAFDKYLNEHLKIRNSEEVIETLRKNNVPCGKVNNLQQCFESKLCRELGMVQQTQGVKYVRSPIRNDEEKRISSPPPRLGEHTEEILKNLGYNEKEIKQLYE